MISLNSGKDYYLTLSPSSLVIDQHIKVLTFCHKSVCMVKW